LQTAETHEESHLQVLRVLASNPHTSQREMAVALGVSLGKANFCMKALLDKGFIKVHNFRTNQNKLTYSYLLTPSGIAAKAALTARFVKRKMAEYEELKAELEAMQFEVGDLNAEDKI